MTSRKRRRELRDLVDRVSQIADERLAEAVAEGMISLSDLPADVVQRLQDALQPPLQGKIVEGDRIEIEGEEQPSALPDSSPPAT